MLVHPAAADFQQRRDLVDGEQVVEIDLRIVGASGINAMGGRCIAIHVSKCHTEPQFLRLVGELGWRCGRHRGRSSLRSSGGCMRTTWRLATCAFLSGRRPKLARGFWGNPPSYRTHKRVISLPVISQEDLRPTQAIA